MDISANQSLSHRYKHSIDSYIHKDIKNKYVLVRMVDDKKLSHQTSWCEDESPWKIQVIALYENQIVYGITHWDPNPNKQSIWSS